MMKTGLPEAGASRTLLPALAELPGHLLWRAHARVTAAIAEHLPEGVDLHAYAVLLALGDGVPRSQQELSRSISVSRTTMTKVAADLAERGLVERVRNPDDKRSWSLTRTAYGARTSRAWERHVDQLEGTVASAFTAAERTELCALLLRIAEDDLAPDTPEPLLTSVGFLVTRVHLRMHREFLAALEPLRIEPRHYAALVALTSLGPVPQADLARALGLSGASVVQIADDLEQRGVVRRRRLSHDRRTQLLVPQQSAPKVVERATLLAHETLDHHFGGLGPRETARLVVLLRRLVTAA